MNWAILLSQERVYASVLVVDGALASGRRRPQPRLSAPCTITLSTWSRWFCARTAAQRASRHATGPRAMSARWTRRARRASPAAIRTKRCAPVSKRSYRCAGWRDTPVLAERLRIVDNPGGVALGLSINGADVVVPEVRIGRNHAREVAGLVLNTTWPCARNRVVMDDA